MMKEETTVYVQAHSEGNGIYGVEIKTMVILYVYAFCESTCINLKLLLLSEPLHNSVELDLSRLRFSTLHENELSEVVKYCRWPVITIGKLIVAGLSAVARNIIKKSNNDAVQYLLGFRENCLMACSEASVWTMFCEVDMPLSIKKLMQNITDNPGEILIPSSISQFEFHLQQPVRIHNMYKKASIQSNKKISVDTPRSDLNLEHKYAEGPDMTISDVILYPLFNILFTLLGENNLETDFPLIHNWFRNMNIISNNKIDLTSTKSQKYCSVIIDNNFIKQSLYRSDMSEYKMEKKLYTKQTNIEKAIRIVRSSNFEVNNENTLYGSDVKFNWIDIPLQLNPCGGSLPEKRAERKCQQLESIVKPVIQIAGDEERTIVDFCSGSGHVGLLLAHLLPKSHIILVENKEKSLSRAVETITKLDLNNVTIVQSNLDYFIGNFDIGVALHACGSSTDLVMQTCIKTQADFVLCPCCYGAIKKCYLLDYPRSQEFSELSELTYRDYLSLAHGADQTHEVENDKTKQGYVCMDIVDTDRKLYAERFGYKVFFGKLQPVTCTNKNNIIVGIKHN